MCMDVDTGLDDFTMSISSVLLKIKYIVIAENKF